MKKRIATLLILACTSFIFAQSPQLELSGVTTQGVGSDPDTFRVYLQSLTGSTVSMRSASLSVLHNSSCSNYIRIDYSFFDLVWFGSFNLAQVQTLPTPVAAGGFSYNRRFVYGNASSAFLPPAFVIAPAAPAKLEVLTILFSGSCTDNLYLEDNSEFFVNSFGDASNNPIPFRVKRSGISLPVEYAQLEANAINESQVDITWTTAQELNSAFFEVEKSFDADFNTSEVIGQVQAAVYSETATDYQFTDNGLMAPVVYYRLRQTELDGQVFISNSMSVNFSDDAAFELSAYPNPFEGILNVKIAKASMQQYNLRVIDITGKVLHEELSSVSNTTHDSWKLELGHLPKGSYFLHVAEVGGDGRSQILKLLK